MNTVDDDDVISRLRAELNTLTADVAANPPPLRSSVGVARVVASSASHNRRRGVVLVAAVVALLAGVAALVAVRRVGDAVGTPDSSSSSAPVVTYATTAGVVHPTPPTPEGWDVVEWGNVRLSLPPDMSPFHVGNGCVTTPQAPDLEIVCGDEFVRMQQASLQGFGDQTFNGLHAALRIGDCTRCQVLDVYELMATVTVSRTSESPLHIIDTVGPSGSWRYQNEPRPPVPADWQTVTYQGASIRVPPDWRTVSSADAGFDPCRAVADTVVLGAARCAEASLQPPTNFARIFQGDPPLSTHSGWPEQQISVQFDTAPSVVVEVGYGKDQSVGLAILNSLSSPTARETPKSDDHVLPGLPYVALGESVMLGAKPILDERGIKTVAEVSKGAAWAVDQLQLVKTQHHLTHGVVIHLGTNGPVTREQYEAVLAEVSDVYRVVVLTVSGSHPWIAGNNEIIRSLPATHPNVVLLDWDARSTEVADHLGSDGVHLGDDVSKAFYANLILEALGLPTS